MITIVPNNTFRLVIDEDVITSRQFIPAGGGGVTTEGFTAITPSVDSRLIYVSSSEGNDSNDGLSPAAPKATMSAAWALMRNGFPDHVYFKCGDTWTNQSFFGIKSGRSEEEPAVIASYGSGDRPHLKFNGPVVGNGGAQGLSSPSYDWFNISIIGLHLHNHHRDPADPLFGLGGSGSFYLMGEVENILIEDCKFNYVELMSIGMAEGNPINIKVRRNIFTGNYSDNTSFSSSSKPSNMFMAGVDGLLIEENVYDYGGWNPTLPNAGANQYNHNVYLQTSNVGNNVIFRKNIVVRGASLGVHGRAGGLFENNFFAKNSIGMQMGFKGTPLQSGTFAYSRNNVVMEGLSQFSKGSGTQCDNGNNVDDVNGFRICTSAVWGINVDDPGSADVQVTGNIVAHEAAPEEIGESIFESAYHSDTNDHSVITYSNNIAYDWTGGYTGAGVATSGTYPEPTRTLATYNQSLGGSNNFDAFMDYVKSRPAGVWYTDYSAPAINNYIRAGFGVSPIGF